MVSGYEHDPFGLAAWIEEKEKKRNEMKYFGARHEWKCNEKKKSVGEFIFMVKYYIWSYL